jgi:hypothetical protein
VARNRGETVARQPLGQHQQGLGGGELGPDADPWARAEGDVLEAVLRGAGFRGEALRIEAVGVVPQRLVAVQDPGPDADIVALLYGEIAELVVGQGLAIDARRGRVKPERFLQHPAR